MVLSNKKLKQKLRATLAESLAAKEAGVQVQDQKSPSVKSFKELLGSATPNSRLSKREKRRKISSLQGPISLDDSNGDTHTEVKKGTIASDVLEENKNKKRKRKEIETHGTENGVSEPKEEKKEKKLKKKKKKNKKKTKKTDNKDKGAEAVKVEAKEQALEATESQEIVDVSTKVYVGGIPYYSTEDDIQSFFESCGTITEMDCMTFPETGKFRGIAMVTFKTEAAAKRALAFDGADMGGLFLKVQPYKASRVAISKSRDFAPEIIEGYNRVYVGNLSWDITEEDLRKFFSDCKVSSIRFGEDKTSGEFRGFAHVDFSDSLSLTIALQLDQKEVCGRPARITCAVPPKKKPGGNSNKLGGSVEIKKAQVVETKKAQVVGASGGKKRRTCYECGVPGHISSECPKKKEVVDPPVSST